MINRNKEQDLFKLANAFYENLERETCCEYGGWRLDIAEIIGLELPEQEGVERRALTDYCHELYNELGDFLKTKWKEFLES